MSENLAERERDRGTEREHGVYLDICILYDDVKILAYDSLSYACSLSFPLSISLTIHVAACV